MCSMDEGLAEEVGSVDEAKCHLQSKEVECPMKLESSDRLDSEVIIRRAEVGAPERPFHVFENMLEDMHASRDAGPIDILEHVRSSIQIMDDTGGMVEELTVRSCDDSNLPIVGTSDSSVRIQTWQRQELKLCKLGGDLGSGSSSSGNNIIKLLPNVSPEGVSASFSDFFGQRSLQINCKDVLERKMGGAEYLDSGKAPSTHGGIKTKMLSKSGFQEFFVKKNLNSKGIKYRGPPREGLRAEPREPINVTSYGGDILSSQTSSRQPVPEEVSNAPLLLGAHKALASFNAMPVEKGVHSASSGVSLREWLRAECHKATKAERLYIFRQIVELVDQSHSQGVVLLDLRPCSFKLLESNLVKYVGSSAQEEGLDVIKDKDFNTAENSLSRKRPLEAGMQPFGSLSAKIQKSISNAAFPNARWPLFRSSPALSFETRNDRGAHFSRTQTSQQDVNENYVQNTNARNSVYPSLFNASHQQSISLFDPLEEKWYSSPEQISEGICNAFSNVYSLGVLLFELLCHFDSENAHVTAMSDLHNRIFPPHFLSSNLKEAGFCLHLLHPESSSRPTARDIRQSEVLNVLQEVSSDELSSSIQQDDAESELLLYFLVLLKEQTQNRAMKLMEDMKCLEADIVEVDKRHNYRKHLLDVDSHLPQESVDVETHHTASPVPGPSENRFLKNVNQLETAYFSMRSKITHCEADCMARSDTDLLKNRGDCYIAQSSEETQDTADPLGYFYDGLCKYARYTKFEVRGTLRSGEFNNSTNVICSLAFDRDEEYFAAAGVSKKIKIFDFNALFKDSVDIHYPSIEMANKTKLSCVCWNNYVKNYLASTDYEGVVKLWDASTGQAIADYNEHEKRAWSVDFSPVYPTKLASGSDDCSVKLWSVNQKTDSISTIRNIANVCCVQFSRHTANLLAFGSADYKTYCYDLRNVRVPWCVLSGHDKAVSYIKFLDSQTIVTASTDNTLKLWDLNKTNSNGLSTNACSLTFGGHTNEKNFVGLTVDDGYIACGSESNEVYAYHRSLPMPITSHNFGSINPVTGKETDDDNGLFVSSVCWREKSDMVVAANSSGCMKVLQMV